MAQSPATLFRQLAVGLCLVLIGCSNNQSSRYSMKQDRAPYKPKKVSHVKDAVPRAEPKSRYGNPPSYKVLGKKYHVLNNSEGYKARGIASWYGAKFHGHKTSNGETYDMYQMTAAHKTLPIPTYVEVRNLDNNKRVIVKVNDRGPFHAGRIIDLSYAAAYKLGVYQHGTARVEVTAINPRKWKKSKPDLYYAQQQAPEAEQSIEQAVYLQAGAYSDKTRAEELANMIRASGEFKVNVKPEGQGLQTLYKVHVGPYLDSSLLEEQRHRLANIAKVMPMRVFQ